GRRQPVLPSPLPPKVTRRTPSGTANERPRRTSRPLKPFRRSIASMTGASVIRSPEQDQQQLGQDEIGDDDARRDLHDGRGRLTPEPLGAAGGGEPVVAPDHGD